MIRYKARVNKIVRTKEEELARKRGKVPGTPGVAMQDGKGLIAMGDVMVTWWVIAIACVYPCVCVHVCVCPCECMFVWRLCRIRTGGRLV
jgi:hypothetical protein